MKLLYATLSLCEDTLNDPLSCHNWDKTGRSFQKERPGFKAGNPFLTHKMSF